MDYKTQKSSNIQNVRRKMKCKSGFKISSAMEPNAMQNFHFGAYCLLQYHFYMFLYLSQFLKSHQTQVWLKSKHTVVIM
jgi:hypothetical protein